MKIAVTASGDTLDAAVDERFGRCAHVLFVETEDMQVKALANPYAKESGGEVGRRVAGWIARRGADVVLTGSLGPEASHALDAAGIRAVADCGGTVRQAVDAFTAREPEEISDDRRRQRAGSPMRRRRRRRRRERRGAGGSEAGRGR